MLTLECIEELSRVLSLFLYDFQELDFIEQVHKLVDFCEVDFVIEKVFDDENALGEFVESGIVNWIAVVLVDGAERGSERVDLCVQEGVRELVNFLLEPLEALLDARHVLVGADQLPPGHIRLLDIVLLHKAFDVCHELLQGDQLGVVDDDLGAFEVGLVADNVEAVLVCFGPV